MAKYTTDEERKNAILQASKRHYEKMKNDPEYRKKKSEASRRYNANNKDSINQQMKEYYHNNKEFRENKKKLTRERFQNDPEKREINNLRSILRYYETKNKLMELQQQQNNDDG